MPWNIQSHEKHKPTTKTTLPARLSFITEGEIKSFPEKKKLKEFVTTKPVLREMFKSEEEEEEEEEGEGGQQRRNIVKR